MTTITEELQSLGAFIISAEPGHVHFSYEDGIGRGFTLGAIDRLGASVQGAFLALAPRGGDFYYNA